MTSIFGKMLVVMKEKKIVLGVIFASAVFLFGVLLLVVVQLNKHSEELYANALREFENGNYQNSYALFSKVSFTSNLKPFAIYRQSMCAKELGDIASEVKQYQLLANNYTKNILGVRSKYFVAQMSVKNNPKTAKKYFKQIIKKAPNSDYAVASEYYLGVLALNEYLDNPKKIFSKSAKDNIERAFRHYLTEAPQGKQALNAVDNWLKIDKEINPDDYLLMAKTYYLFEDYDNANKLLANADENESWTLWAKVAYAQGYYGKAKSIIEQGLHDHTKGIDSNEIKEITDLYIKMSADKKQAVDFLYNLSETKDYIWHLKCEFTSSDSKSGCYRQLYLTYPQSEYASPAIANIFFEHIRMGDYQNARKIGVDFLNKFPNSELKPFITFWLGKIAWHTRHYEESEMYYRKVIHEYPDSYYAYRAFLGLKHYRNSVLNVAIKEEPVVYPYGNLSKRNVIFTLVKLQDYDILNLISDDVFVKSWVLYQKGDWAGSMLLAREGMKKISPKPDKHDLRWRLVYPIHYYDKIQKYHLNNNPVLILSLIREESYFNPNATSPVGAKGLMQLMPSTAYEIAHANVDLYDPDLNLKIGNLYYANLKKQCIRFDIAAVIAYNGGIGSLIKWFRNASATDTDEFVEQIPYPETKNYVKKVLRSYWNYLRIYSNN